MNLKQFPQMVLAYLIWVVFILAGIVVLVYSRMVLNGWLAKYYLTGEFQPMKIAQFLNQWYFFIGGIIFFAIIIIVEEYLKRGAIMGRLWQRAAKALGIVMLFMFVAVFINGFVLGFSAEIILEALGLLVVGGAMVWFGSRKPTIPAQIPN